MQTTNESRRHENLEEYRIRATRLLKDLRSGEAPRTEAAAARILRVSALAGRAPADVRRGDALAVVAAEAGFESWAALKAFYAASATAHFDTAQLFQPATRGFLNRWFARYDEARAVLEVDPSCFLFPYRSQYFICEPTFLESFGADPGDADWERIGHDWVRPADPRAWARLCVRLRRAARGAQRGKV